MKNTDHSQEVRTGTNSGSDTVDGPNEVVSRVLTASCWPLAICFLYGAFDIISEHPVVAPSHRNLVWLFATIAFSSLRPLLLWFAAYCIAGILPCVLWRRPPQIPSLLCLAIGLLAVVPSHSPTATIQLMPYGLAIVVAAWTDRLEPGPRRWAWVRLPLALMVFTAASILVFWLTQFPLRETVGRAPGVCVGILVAMCAIVLTASARSSGWGRGLIVAAAAVTAGMPTIDAVLDESFEIRPYIAPIAAVDSLPPVILIVIDTLRADSLSYANPEAGPTPHIDALAGGSVVFANAISPASWTFPAMSSIMSGIAPLQDPKALSYLTPDAHTMAEYLDDHGYASRAIAGNPLMTRPFRPTDGFMQIDTFSMWPFGSSHASQSLADRLPAEIANGGPTEYLTNQAIEWIDEIHSGPSLLWLHHIDPHIPHSPPVDLIPAGAPTTAGYGFADVKIKKALYLAEVKYIDREIGRLMSALQSEGVYDDALIILTSDHGEEFYDHSGVEHGHTLYQELLHVPLMFKLPGQLDGKRIDDFVTTQAILPTVLDVVGIEVDKEPGWVNSLFPVMIGEAATAPADPIISGATYGEIVESQWSVVVDGMKYIHRIDSGVEEIYDLRNDPTEQASLIDRYPEVAERAREILVKHHAFAVEMLEDAGMIDPQTQEDLNDRMRSIGYIQ